MLAGTRHFAGISCLLTRTTCVQARCALSGKASQTKAPKKEGKKESQGNSDGKKKAPAKKTAK
eukprot:2689435-Rhodomonas_salina.4